MHDVIQTIENEDNPSRATAIANLHMLMQYSTGLAKPKKAGDPQQRYERVLAFLMTGTCVVDPELQPTIQAIDGALRQAKAKAA
jgi:hypothetical protein